MPRRSKAAENTIVCPATLLATRSAAPSVGSFPSFQITSTFLEYSVHSLILFWSKLSTNVDHISRLSGLGHLASALRATTVGDRIHALISLNVEKLAPNQRGHPLFSSEKMPRDQVEKSARQRFHPLRNHHPRRRRADRNGQELHSQNNRATYQIDRMRPSTSAPIVDDGRDD